MTLPPTERPHAYDSTYFQLLEEGWNRKSFPIISGLLRDRCPAPAPGPVLDFGCGGGAYSGPLRERAERLEGCDVAEESRNRVRGRYDHFFPVQGVDDLPSDTYGMLFSSEVLEHIPDHRAALRGWRRALRPGGVVFMTTTLYAPAVFFMLYTWKARGLGVGAALRGLVDWLAGFTSEARRDRFVKEWLYDCTGGHFHGFSRRRLEADVREAGFELVDSGVFFAIEPLYLQFIHSHGPLGLLRREGWPWPKRVLASLAWFPLSLLNRLFRATGRFANNVWITARRPVA